MFVTEPSDQTPTPEDADVPPRRLAIFEGEGAEKTPLGIVAAFKTDDGNWSLQCSADTGDAIGKIRSVLEPHAAKGRASRAADRVPDQPDFAELAAAFSQHGYIVEEIPAGDYQVSLQLDLERGTMIATHAAMHNLAPSDNPLGRQVFDAIAQGFVKASDDLATECDLLLDRKEIDGAVMAVRSAAEKGVFSFPPSKRLLNTLTRFDVSILSPEDRRFILEERVLLAHRLGRFDVAGRDADLLLIEDSDNLSAEKIAALKMTVALGAIKKGNRETGLSILRDLLKPPSTLDAEGRGWAWRNIALILDKNDPEARRAAQLSADSFLEAGKKQEAGKSLMHLANLLIEVDPAEAVTRLNEMIGLLDTEGLLDRHVRAAALHSRANRFARLNKHTEAFRDACEAVKLRRGLLGADEAFVSSLHLAAFEACHIGDQAAADAFEEEAEKLTEEWKLPHFQLAARVSRLAVAFDTVEATDLLAEAEAANNLEVIVAVRVFRAMLDKSLTDTARLEILEDTLSRIVSARGDSAMMKPVQLAIGQLLARRGQLDRAERWFREVLNADALDGFAQSALIDCLWRQEKWGDAAIFLRKQLRLRGELPGLTFALGKSQLEAGDMSSAVTTFTRLLNVLGGDENLRKSATDLRERALQLGGTILPTPLMRAVGSVTRVEFESALDDFARFIAAEKRMRFWVSDEKSGYKWVAGPEGRAQDLLHTFLKARFGDRVEIFEEVGTGAGRLDLYVKMEGDLGIIIELKMCGGGYSSAYAASGEEQINHYMDNRKTHLGYLVVFDARVNLFGQQLFSTTSGSHTVIEKIVDVRNRVKQA